MRFAADLHLHSRHAAKVSPDMTLVNIARTALLKGVDLLGTGDALQAEWLDELERNLEEVAPGWHALREETRARVEEGVPERLRRPLRFVASVEVSCAPPGTPPLGGLHQLVYFPSLASARGFRERMLRHGDLRDGRPELALSGRDLLAEVKAHDADCHLAPAHVLNPWYSTLGSVSGGASVEEIFGEAASELVAIELGLTATPGMCRRLSCLDRFGLFANSDAHSPESIGRECTLLEIEPGYRELFTALRAGTSDRGVLGVIKYPLERTRYFRNRCARCQESFDGARCSRCRRVLTTGSRDRLEVIADRPAPKWPPHPPSVRELLPLGEVIADLLKVDEAGKAVAAWRGRLVPALGHERHVLTEAGEAEISEVATAALARAIVAQRSSPPARRERPWKNDEGDGQMSLL